MSRRGWTAALALLLLAAAGSASWWLGSPWWTLQAMQRAADARDGAALSRHIDYPALRADVKAQLREQLATRTDLPLRGAERLFAGTLAEGIADAAIRPEAIRLVFAAAPVSDAVRGRRGGFGLRAETMALRREGLDGFRLVDRGGSGAALVFRRHGLGWKLAGIRLPERVALFTR